MARLKKVKSFKNMPLDVFEAMRRALVYRGHVRQQPPAKKVPRILKRPKRLRDVTVKGHDILFRATTIFPFNLFPDTVTLDREKLTFATRYFFRVAKITSIPVRDILSVEVDVGPFFGSVHTSSRYFITIPKSVTFLWREDAIKLQRLLQGYIIVHEQDIDCSKIDTDKLKVMLNDLGKGETD